MDLCMQFGASFAFEGFGFMLAFVSPINFPEPSRSGKLFGERRKLFDVSAAYVH